MSKKVEERIDRIMQAILRAGTISIQELADQIDTSAASILRNLAEIEKRGLILRTHGGATLVEPQLYEPFRYDTSFQVWELHYAKEKRHIGLTAAQLIQEKDMVGFQPGPQQHRLDAR